MTKPKKKPASRAILYLSLKPALREQLRKEAELQGRTMANLAAYVLESHFNG